MPKRRRVASLLALAVLSGLVERPMHPYELAATLRDRGKDRDMPIKWGSLYTVVANLEKHGLIEALGSTRQGSRPERTVYTITGEGLAELRDWIEELVEHPLPELPRFKAGLSVLAILGPDQATTLLSRRLGTLEHQLAEDQQALDAAAAQVPRLFLIESEYDVAMRRAEIAWVRALLGELTAGAFPGQAAWRDWITTGRPPDEQVLAAMAPTADGDPPDRTG